MNPPPQSGIWIPVRCNYQKPGCCRCGKCESGRLWHGYLCAPAHLSAAGAQGMLQYGKNCAGTKYFQEVLCEKIRFDFWRTACSYDAALCRLCKHCFFRRKCICRCSG